MAQALGPVTILTPVSRVNVDLNVPMIFLGGPIQGSEDWQTKAIEMLRLLALGPLYIANPRLIERGLVTYEEQVDWETKHLYLASQKGCVLFWLAKETQVIPGRCHAQTSRFEIGEHFGYFQANQCRLAVGIASGFSGERYIRHRFRNDLDIHDDLQATCQAAISEMFDGRER